MCTAPNAKCLLLRYPRSLVLWKLGGSEPSKILEWRPSNDGRIRTAALASDASWLAVSTQERFGLYSLKVSFTYFHLPILTLILRMFLRYLCNTFVCYLGKRTNNHFKEKYQNEELFVRQLHLFCGRLFDVGGGDDQW